MRRPIRRAAFPVLALATFLLAAACGDMKDLVELASGVTREFGQASVKLSNGSHLLVLFQNSAAAGRPDEAQTARAVAEYVRDHYPAYDGLEDVTVGYQTHRQYGPVGFTEGQGSYTFTRAELGEPHRRLGAGYHRAG